MTQKMRNLRVTQAISKWLVANDLHGEVHIYFNDRVYSFENDGKITRRSGIKGSTRFHYANDDTVSMSFEGPLYEVLNFYHPRSGELHEQLTNLVWEHGFWFEKGNAWNLSLYNMEDL
jgi:hypothetical protein|tara:strand:+ start:188 stop:541 length:354 start_codon:yes stop_codon:yes gene_type:complete